MRINGIIKRFLGVANYIDVIADKESKANISDGFAGGSLANDNILVVSNFPLPEQDVEMAFKKEKADYVIISTNKTLDNDTINIASSELVGPFTHIINIFYDTEQMALINSDGRYNENDASYLFYQWHQQEADYLVNLNQYATICSLFISGESTDCLVKQKNAEMLIRGLSEVLSNHGIICNGIVANNNHCLKELLESSVFLSSRYGQIMTGEVLSFID